MIEGAITAYKATEGYARPFFFNSWSAARVFATVVSGDPPHPRETVAH
jgi:hypothetical protein